MNWGRFGGPFGSQRLTNSKANDAYSGYRVFVVGATTRRWKSRP